MAKKSKNQGISPAGKAAILGIVFGVPILFAASSWGLSKLFETAPFIVVGLVAVIATAYTSYTTKLMFDFYDVNAPFARFIPCIGEVQLMDVKYHKVCYIFYALAIVFGTVAMLPYDILKVLGEAFALDYVFYVAVAAIVCLAVVQIVKGIGITATMKDIGNEWHKQTHAEMGVLSKFFPLAFIPFVRVIAIYAINKPLSTMVSFMGVSVEDAEEESEFEEEEDEED